MHASAYDLKAFYHSRIGLTVRHILRERLRGLWPDVKGLEVLGLGYAIPYLRPFMSEAERVYAAMPGWQGVHHWPSGEKGLTALADEERLPFASSTLDRVILFHHLEFSHDIRGSLEEVWRILRPNGRLIVVVPNRTALWAQADWTPFGGGRPYTASQLSATLLENKFVHERTEQALYFPPIRFAPVLKTAFFMEKYGRYVWPLGGVHIVESSKQLYARIDKPKGSKMPVRRMVGARAQPVPSA